VVTTQSNPKTREATVQFVMQRIHQLGDTDHFVDDEWIFLQMTWQTTAGKIVMQPGYGEANWNNWKPADEKIYTLEQSRTKTMKLPQRYEINYGERPEVNHHHEQPSHQQWRTLHHRFGAQRESTRVRDKTSHVKMHHAENDLSHQKLIMLQILRKIWGEFR
jgi:hypothetical protein